MRCAPVLVQGVVICVALLCLGGATGCVATDGQRTEPPKQGLACAPGEADMGDRCQPAGVPESLCAEGFVHQGRACEAILPEAPCAAGEAAIPGDTACHSLVACDDAWMFDGAMTVVRAGQSIATVVAAAADGDTIAVDAGVYPETVVIDRAITLRGICPSAVSVAAIDIRAATVTVRGISVDGTGIKITEGARATLSQLWIHDTASVGIFAVESTLELSDTLVEGARGIGVQLASSQATIDRSVVRDTVPVSTPHLPGSGVSAYNGATTIRRALIERNAYTSLVNRGGDMLVEATVIRDTSAFSDGKWGRGVYASAPGPGQPQGTLTMRSSVIERSKEVGILAIGTRLVVEGVVIRDTAPNVATGSGGSAIAAQADGDVRGSVLVSASLLERNSSHALFLAGVDGEVNATAISGIEMDQAMFGRGVSVQASVSGQRSKVLLRSLAVSNGYGVGIYVSGSDAEIVKTSVSTILPSLFNGRGRGINIQADPDTGDPSNAIIRGSLVEDCYDTGVIVIGANATMRNTIVRDTKANTEGTMGDGVAVLSDLASASISIEGSTIEGNARAGVSNFGALVAMRDTLIDCNAIDLVASQSYDGSTPTFDNGDGNICRCDDEEAACKVISADIDPPDPVTEE